MISTNEPISKVRSSMRRFHLFEFSFKTSLSNTVLCIGEKFLSDVFITRAIVSFMYQIYVLACHLLYISDALHFLWIKLAELLLWKC